MNKETIAFIRERLAANPTPAELLRWSADSRTGVRQAVAAYTRREEKRRAETERLQKLYTYEREWYVQGKFLVAGTDEAGRGPVAGPVTVAAVVLPPELELVGLNDSKKLSAAKREDLYQRIREEALAYRIVHVSAAEIDRVNIYQAVINGMEQAIRELQPAAEAVLSDAMPLAPGVPVRAIIHGDALSASIAAASVLAKVSRDHLMDLYDREYPGYGFALHKGYLTELHLHKLQELGPSPIHRRSFEPVKSMR